MAHNGKLENYLKGLRDGMGIGIAYTPFGITIGLISKNFGMKLFTAIVMSFGLYAGSAQTAFLKMVYELKSTPFEIIVSIFVINLRYTLLNIIMFRQISNKTTLFEKILMGIGLTDEAVAYLTIRKATNAWYVIGVNTMPYVLFGVGTIAGSLFGNLIPEVFAASLNFMLYATFLSLLVSSLTNSLKYAEVIITAIGLKLLFMFAPVLRDISKGWTLIIIMITASSLYALRHYKEESEKETVENE